MASNARHSIPRSAPGVDYSSGNESLRFMLRLRRYFIALEKVHVAEMSSGCFPACSRAMLLARSLLEVNCANQRASSRILIAKDANKGESPCKQYVSLCAN
jgi:hypothetical protein